MDPFYLGKTVEACLGLGLSLVPNFISEEEEANILDFISQYEYAQIEERNSVQRFGSAKPYPKDMISNSIPPHLNSLSDKIVNSGLLKEMPDSVSINEYFPGQGIAPHIDSDASGEIITVLSLLGHTVIKFSKKNEAFDVLFPARCLMQMRGLIRKKWKHAIDPVTSDVLPFGIIERTKRISIVFRCSNEKTTG